ncbi:MAG: hypothetical protein EBS54_09170 [Betaproteobacteria bacterium]|nr:hypothetical protein [Betaproteobacteria bacterium]
MNSIEQKYLFLIVWPYHHLNLILLDYLQSLECLEYLEYHNLEYLEYRNLEYPGYLVHHHCPHNH